MTFLCLGLALLLRSGIAVADEALEAAKTRYEQGEKAFEAGRFLEAAQSFEAAYKLSPRADLLYDAARSYDKGGNAARAVELYQAYLRTGDQLPEEALVKERLEDLQRLVAYLTVRANRDGAQVLVDGQERGATPLLSSIPIGSGLHKIEVRLGDMSWRTEQEFQVGLSHTVTAELVPPPPAVEEEKHNKRFAVLFGIGGLIDVTSNNFPPSQAVLHFGLDFRLLERRPYAIDLMVRVPVELGQGWTNSGIVPGVRFVLNLSRKVPLELVPAIGLGFAALHIDESAPPFFVKNAPCKDISGNRPCTIPSLRINPSIGLVYHFLPDWELRGELFGLVADIGSPIVEPRVAFSLSGAWRFY